MKSYPGYTTADLAANKRLSRCRHCGGDIFYMVVPREPQEWWHEAIEADSDHIPEPMELIGDKG